MSRIDEEPDDELERQAAEYGPKPSSNGSGQIAPHDLAVEEALLGAFLDSRNAFDDAVSMGLAADDFYRPAHKIVFDAISKAVAELGPDEFPGPVLVGLRLDETPRTAEGVPLLIHLQTVAAHKWEIRPLTEQVIDYRRRLRLLAAAEQLKQVIHHGGNTDAALEQILAIGADRTGPAKDGTLGVVDVAIMAAEVDAMPPPTFLARPVWPADAYGIIGAEDKAGKSWAAIDLAVAVASGGAWLGAYVCENPGPVLFFAGEGGKRKITRRGRAVAEQHGCVWEELPIRISERAPQIANNQAIAKIGRELQEHPAVLVIIDPLYLAAKGANQTSLYEMGAQLEGVQHICQQHGAALVVVHHWNQTGTGTGRARFSGAGPAEWGRVLASMSVENKATEGAMTVVRLKWEFIGDEIPDTELVLERRVWADDPGDLASPLHYTTTVIDTSTTKADGGGWDGPTQCMAAITKFFADHPHEELSKNATFERLRDLGGGYRNVTVGSALERLADDGQLTVRDGPRKARLFTTRSADDPLDF